MSNALRPLPLANLNNTTKYVITHSRKKIFRCNICAARSAYGVASRRYFGNGVRLGFQQSARHGVTVENLDKQRDRRERVVILGSGWAGYTLARRLDPTRYQAVLVSPRSYFVFTPLLASTSVGTLEFRTALEPIRSRRMRANYFQGWADDVNLQSKTLSIEAAAEDTTTDVKPGEPGKREKGEVFELGWDKLVVAVGCYSQTFGTPGVREHALFLKDVGDARKIRKRLLGCFEAASLPTTGVAMKRVLLNFAVVGGGPTGIEFSAELHDLISDDLSKLYPDLMQYVKVTVYDVAPSVLSMFDENLGKYAVRTFAREGIAIKTSHHVESLRKGAPEALKASGEAQDEHAVFTLKLKEEGEVGVGMVVWSTGLMTNPFVERAFGRVQTLAIPHQNSVEYTDQGPKQSDWVLKKHSKTGAITTDERLRVTMQTPDTAKDSSTMVLKDVFAIGDCATQDGLDYPATAQVASQKAEWLAKRLNKGDIESQAFTWRDLGIMAYIGNWKAIVQSKGGSISGRTAWIIWRGAYLTKSVSWRNKILIPIYWFLNWAFGRDISRF